DDTNACGTYRSLRSRVTCGPTHLRREWRSDSTQSPCAEYGPSLPAGEITDGRDDFTDIGFVVAHVAGNGEHPLAELTVRLLAPVRRDRPQDRRIDGRTNQVFTKRVSNAAVRCEHAERVGTTAFVLRQIG